MTQWVSTEKKILNRCALVAILVCIAPVSVLVAGKNFKANDVEQNLMASLGGKILILRNFYRGSRLRFDTDGNLQKGGPAGYWTVAGKIKIERIRIRPRMLQIEGMRVFLAYEQGKKKFRNVKGNHVTIEMELDQSPASLDALTPALRKVFLAPGEQVCDIVPDYWRPYCVREQNPDQNLQNVEELERTLRSQLQDGTPPTPVRVPEPPYSEEARQAGLQGVTTLLITVDAQGNVSEAQVVTPLGMGLDDQAIETIKTWKFHPATQKGIPVSVRVIVEINFRL